MTEKKSIYELQMELDALNKELAGMQAPKPRVVGMPRPINMKYSTLYKGIVIPTSVTGERLERVVNAFGWPVHP